MHRISNSLRCRLGLRLLLQQLFFNPAAQIPVLDGPRIVVINGVVDVELSSTTGSAGLSLSSLLDARRDQPERIGSHFDHGNSEITDAYMALNLAFGNDGAVVLLDDDVVLDVPIHIVHIGVPDETRNASCTGVVIEVGARSSATVVETRIGVGSEFGGSNIRTTVTLGTRCFARARAPPRHAAEPRPTQQY